MTSDKHAAMVAEAKRYNRLVAIPDDELAERFARLTTFLKVYREVDVDSPQFVEADDLENLTFLGERSMLLYNERLRNVS